MGVTKKQKSWVDKMNEVLGKLKKLPTAASMPGFDKLKPPIQGMVLETLAARPDDAALAKHVQDLLGGPAFSGLTDTRQTEVLKLIQRFRGQHKNIENLLAIINGLLVFDAQPAETQKMILDAFASKPHDAAFVKSIIDAVMTLGFPTLDPFLQNDVLLRLRDMPSDAETAVNLVALFTAKDFDSIDPTVQNEILDNLSKRYPGVRLSTKMIKNITTLSTVLVFKKLNPKTRELIFDLLAAKPENEQLAEAFRELVDKYGPRTAQGQILDVDEKHP